MNWFQHLPHVQQVGKRGFEFADIATAFHKEKTTITK
jgi:hypothetical protein